MGRSREISRGTPVWRHGARMPAAAPACAADEMAAADSAAAVRARRTAAASWPFASARGARTHRDRLVGWWGDRARLLHSRRYPWRAVVDFSRARLATPLVRARRFWIKRDAMSVP